MGLLGTRANLSTAAQPSEAVGLPKDIPSLASQLSNSGRLNRAESFALSVHGAAIIDAFGHSLHGKPTEEGLLTNSVLEFAINQMRNGNPISVELLESLLALRETARLPERTRYVPQDGQKADIFYLDFPETGDPSEKPNYGQTEVIELNFPEDKKPNPLAAFMNSDKAA